MVSMLNTGATLEVGPPWMWTSSDGRSPAGPSNSGLAGG